MPVTYRRGAIYILVMADYDINYILAYPLTSHSKTELLHAITKLYKYLTDRGLQPGIHILDNEFSDLTKYYIIKDGGTHQLLTPGLQ